MKSDFINELGILFNQNNSISDDDYNKLDVKRGLRNKNGTGVLVGLTKIGAVQGYTVDKKGTATVSLTPGEVKHIEVKYVSDGKKFNVE